MAAKDARPQLFQAARPENWLQNGHLFDMHSIKHDLDGSLSQNSLNDNSKNSNNVTLPSAAPRLADMPAHLVSCEPPETLH